MNSKKYALFGYFGYKNLGDELILDVFEKKLGNCDIFSDSGNKRHFPRKNFLRLLKNKQLIFPGGTIFQDKSSSLSLYYYLFFVLLMKIFSGKVYIINNGFGPFRNRFNRFLFRKVIDLCDFVSARTLKDLEILKGTKHNTLGADSFFLNSPEFEPNKGLKKGFIPKIRYVKFNNVPEDIDILAMEPCDFRFYSELYPERENIIRLYDMSLSDVGKLFHDYKSIFSIPLHGIILSYYFGVEKIFCFPYDEKVRYFSDEISDEINVMNEMDLTFSESEKTNRRAMVEELHRRAGSFYTSLR